MKKTVIFIAIAICVFRLCGCSSQESISDTSHHIEQNAQNTDVSDGTTEKEWSEQEIISMFTNVKNENWDIIDCVVIPDKAYDRVGAVLFWNNENETSNVAFLDADGYYQRCGVYAKTPSESGFTYLGNGAVTFKLETDNGTVCNYTLTISIDGSDVHFKAEDGLQKKQ